MICIYIYTCVYLWYVYIYIYIHMCIYTYHIYISYRLIKLSCGVSSRSSKAVSFTSPKSAQTSAPRNAVITGFPWGNPAVLFATAWENGSGTCLETPGIQLVWWIWWFPSLLRNSYSPLWSIFSCLMRTIMFPPGSHHRAACQSHLAAFQLRRQPTVCSWQLPLPGDISFW